MNKVLLSTGLKYEGNRFAYKYAQSLQQEKGTPEGETTVKNTCCFLSFINASQILTGQFLIQAHCTCCVETIRVFFVLCFIKLAESQGAIRNGYLAEVLNKAIDDARLVASFAGPEKPNDAAIALVSVGDVPAPPVCGLPIVCGTHA